MRTLFPGRQARPAGRRESQGRQGGGGSRWPLAGLDGVRKRSPLVDVLKNN